MNAARLDQWTRREVLRNRGLDKLPPREKLRTITIMMMKTKRLWTTQILIPRLPVRRRGI